MRAAPIPPDEAARLGALRAYDVAEVPPVDALEPLARLAASVANLPIALITLVDEARERFIAQIGADQDGLPRDLSFGSHAVLGSEILEIEDLQKDERFLDHPWVESEPKARSYVGVPLRTPQGFHIGTLSLFGRTPRRLEPAQSEALQTLARQVMAQLELCRKTDEMARFVEDRREMEDALRGAKVLYHSLVDTIPQNLFRKDLAGRFTFANHRFCASLGRPLGEILGKTDFDLYPPALAAKYQQDDRRVIETLKPIETIETNQGPEFGRIQVQVIKTPIFDLENIVCGVQGVFWDVTERLKMEEALAWERELLRALLDNAPDRIYFKDAQGRYIKCSKAMAHRLGLEEPGQVVGKTDFDFFSQQQARESEAEEKRVLETGQPLINKIDKHIDPFGRELWAAVTRVPLYNPAGKITGIIGISRDITKLKQTEAELGKARDAAMESARIKSEFLANMSHEIRTPMNGIIGMTSLLQDTALTDEQRDFVGTIQSSADALLGIINEILDFSKVEAGKLLLEHSEFALSDAIESTVDLLAERAQAKGLELAVWIDSQIPRGVRGDPGRFRQVLTNLISNAVKFTDHGEIVVRVEKDSETERMAVVRVSVSDTGIGIPPEVLPRLFLAFSQADGSTTRRFGGTGLGLAISKRLVELMGGKIGVDSTPGRGSVFWFTLPLEKQPAGLHGTDSSGEPRGLSGLRVMLVDDNATQREFLKQQADAWRMDNLVARSGDEALALLRREAISGKPMDLVIVDSLAPPMDGIALARAIRTDPSLGKIRVVMLTTMASRLDRGLMEGNGIAACVTKPIKQSRLYDTLSQVMEDVLLAPPSPAPGSSDNTVFITAKPAVPLRPVRILLVEDNVVNQKVTLRQLQKLGFSADAVANGIEALEALRRFPYSIILMDCQMPEMDGYEATRHIRQSEEKQRQQGNAPTTKVIIALTAKALQGDRERCIEAGMDDYVSKPVQIGELEAALQRAVDAVSPSPAKS